MRSAKVQRFFINPKKSGNNVRFSGDLGGTGKSGELSGCYKTPEYSDRVYAENLALFFVAYKLPKCFVSPLVFATAYAVIQI